MIRPSNEVSVKDVSQHYNDLDGIYRAVWSDHLHHGLWNKKGLTKDEAVRNLVLKVVELGEIRDGARVCDVGCGYGATSRLLAKEYHADVLGFTVSEAQHEYAVSKSKSGQEPGNRSAKASGSYAENCPENYPEDYKVEYIKEDWLNNQLKPNSFDHVISIESSEHMPNLEKFFQEAYRVLKPGGTFVICAWLTKENPSAREINYLLKPICTEGRLVGMGTVSEYREMFRSTGFERVTHEDLTKNVKKTWSLSLLGLLPHFIKNPKDLRLLSSRFNPNRNFLSSLFRIRVAYEMGAMKYGIFTGTKPKNGESAFF